MKPRVLVVDDDEKNITLLSIRLERDGYEVESAQNGLVALQKARTFNPDLIIMDVMMPVMDGYEALRQLKASDDTRYIPVIMLTGRIEIEDKIMGFEVGAEDYINKPYSLVEVSARVKSLLRMRALQTKLRETEKMAALGEMVDGIAHEVRNPLTTIGGMARRLYEAESDPQRKVYSQRIIKSVERLERMIKRIDEYKEILVSTLVKGNLNSVALEAVESMKELTEGKEIEIKLELSPDIPDVMLDQRNLKVAVFNVLQNSVEAIEHKGRITVSTGFVDDSVQLRVMDTGAGISEDDIRRIINPFQTTKLEGAGLGLTITYRILQDHRAELNISSKKGEGTAVSMKFRPVRSEAK